MESVFSEYDSVVAFPSSVELTEISECELPPFIFVSIPSVKGRSILMSWPKIEVLKDIETGTLISSETLSLSLSAMADLVSTPAGESVEKPQADSANTIHRISAAEIT